MDESALLTLASLSTSLQNNHPNEPSSSLIKKEIDNNLNQQEFPDDDPDAAAAALVAAKMAADTTPGDESHLRGWSKRYKRRRSAVKTFYDLDEVKSPLMKQAEEIMSTLPDNTPSFLKKMVRSNCQFGSWMHLPMQFCKMHMPKQDTTFFLVGEKEKVFKSTYIAERTALSAGWKAFSKMEDLNEGDVVVFHLIEETKFRIYVVKANHSDSDDRGSDVNRLDSDFVEEDTKSLKKTKNLDLVHVANSQENGGNDDGGNDEMTLDGIEDFTIVVNGVNIGSELSTHQLSTYYELCRSQNSNLHDQLLSTIIDHNLVTGIIIQTVNVAKAIRASKVFTSLDDYEIHDRILEGLEMLGMNVGFLRARLKRLMNIVLESKEAKKCRELEVKKVHAKKEMKSLELKMKELKNTVKRIDAKIEKMKVKAERHGDAIEQEANTPW